VSTAAQLRFDLAQAALPAGVRARAASLAGARLTGEGVIVITADRHRTQALNREDAIARLVDLLRAAATPPKPRRPTRPTLASKQRRLKAKSERSGVKRLRAERPGLE
jgi:ribosome-associated protein